MNTSVIETNNRRLKVLFLLWLLPCICEYIFGWSNPNSSPGYSYAPLWFSYIKTLTQCLLLVVFLYPFRIKITNRNILICFFLVACFLDLLIYKYTHDSFQSYAVYKANEVNLLVIKSIFIFIAFVFLVSFFNAKVFLQESSIKFIFNIFFVGFIVQIFIFYFLDISPSHSQNFFLLPRFNGVTNDSLATGLILPLFIPFLLSKKNKILYSLILILLSILTGSLSSLFITLLILFAYLVYKKLFSVIFFCVFALVVFGVFFYEEIMYVLYYKFDSILVHLDYFIMLYSNKRTDCEEVFCESFFAWSQYISGVTFLSFYACLGYMIKKLFDFDRDRTNQVTLHSFLCLGFSILLGSFFHPVINIPFSINLFFIAFFILANQYKIPLTNLKL